MLKFISGFLLAALVVTGSAQAIEYNQWRLMPAAKKAAPEAENQAGARPDQEKKKKRQRAERVRLVNVKDKSHKLVIACRVNSGHVQINAISAKNAEKTAEKGQKTTLSLMIDGKSVLKDSAAAYRRAARGNIAVHTNLNGDDTVHFISQFLAAKKTIAVAFGGGAAESYTAANAAQAGLALQNCLHK